MRMNEIYQKMWAKKDLKCGMDLRTYFLDVNNDDVTNVLYFRAATQ
jgi:hypothetical protein